jgi:hypothetical protein
MGEEEQWSWEGGMGVGGMEGPQAHLLHNHASQSDCKTGAQESYLIFVVDTGRGAAVEEELHDFYTRTPFRGRGVHQQSPSILQDKGCEDGIYL